MKKYYAVIDTNVIVSAALRWKSVPGSILELAFSGVIIPVLNNEIVAEYKEVLSRPKFKFTKDIVKDIIEEISKNAVFVDGKSLNIDLPDPKDRVFYEVTMEERQNEDAYLVTGNIKHFPMEPFVVTPRAMLDIVLENIDDNYYGNIY
ncbi:MAG: putative toxin-antitoxin system toxin component, PIN family [Butyrivibrio sp.]|uniref:putative toxin-antitoxin system toxin component, PIN family n=1 Tax=Butyrivibrio sp. LB2008 TaxID=1408305 RepID=UPI0004788198|nr:putative toxin-antitoxin system toxin component, PIN family [Butyrivibrio sp. LB2008]MBQ4218259.1 putative toxin-antitoxin system toxin component, PIN family [Butyrivibrio sp.]